MGRRCQMTVFTIAVSRKTRNQTVGRGMSRFGTVWHSSTSVVARIGFTSGWVRLRWRPSHVYRTNIARWQVADPDFCGIDRRGDVPALRRVAAWYVGRHFGGAPSVHHFIFSRAQAGGAGGPEGHRLAGGRQDWGDPDRSRAVFPERRSD